MEKQEYLNMSEDERFNFLNSQAAAGKSFAQIISEMSLTKEELAKQGFYWVGNKFMRKPMKGYVTTVRSGNEKKE